MSDAPERILMAPNGGLPCGHWDKADLVEYVRADHALALVAAAYEAAGERCGEISDRELSAATHDYASGYSDGADCCEHTIRALTPADAQAALDALIQREKAKAISEARHCNRCNRFVQVAAIREGKV